MAIVTILEAETGTSDGVGDRRHYAAPVAKRQFRGRDTAATDRPAGMTSK